MRVSDDIAIVTGVRLMAAIRPVRQEADESPESSP